MIRITPQPEPTAPEFDFDQEVRQPGISALAELVGKKPTISRPGPRIKKRADSIDKLDPSMLRDYAYWTRALPSLHKIYREVCAYSCFRISLLHVPTVDHFVALSSARLVDAYEWGNYRLACSLMNSCKREFPDVLDPFSIDDGWFTLDLNTLDVKPADGLAVVVHQRVVSTIARLKLNGECKLERERYFNLYWAPDFGSHVPLSFLEKEAPFLVREMRRQGRVRPEDDKRSPLP
jgi:hypothetical protein